MSDQERILAVDLMGPGSQPEEEGSLSYLTMPAEMSTFDTPLMPEPEEIGDCSAAFALLDRVQLALQDRSVAAATVFDLAGLDESSLTFINQLLGVGEVSVSIASETPIEIQESVMAGLWRVLQRDSAGQLMHDYLEVAAIPSVVVRSAFESARHCVPTDMSEVRQGIANAPALLVEIDEKIRHLQPGAASHMINLSLLPLSAEDLILLGERLGVGPVTILSRGYGNCRIGSTACKSTWWIKYYNSEDALIMNTIEVVDVPEVAMAAPEDLADSAERLHEILEIYR